MLGAVVERARIVNGQTNIVYLSTFDRADWPIANNAHTISSSSFVEVCVCTACWGCVCIFTHSLVAVRILHLISDGTARPRATPRASREVDVHAKTCTLPCARIRNWRGANMCNYRIDTYQFSHHQIHLVNCAFCTRFLVHCRCWCCCSASAWSSRAIAGFDSYYNVYTCMRERYVACVGHTRKHTSPGIALSDVSCAHAKRCVWIHLPERWPAWM